MKLHNHSQNACGNFSYLSMRITRAGVKSKKSLITILSGTGGITESAEYAESKAGQMATIQPSQE